MTRMPSLTALTQYIPGSIIQGKPVREKNKEHQIGNKENKLSLFAVNMILDIENSIKIIY